MRADGLARLAHARDQGLLRSDLAHWQIAELFQLCLPLALIDVANEPDFEAFRQLWLPMVGEAAAGWLPPLYLAAASSPSIVAEARLTLVLSALPFLPD